MDLVVWLNNRHTLHIDGERERERDDEEEIVAAVKTVRRLPSFPIRRSGSHHQPSDITLLGQQTKGAQGCNKLLSEHIAPQAC